MAAVKSLLAFSHCLATSGSRLATIAPSRAWQAALRVRESGLLGRMWWFCVCVVTPRTLWYASRVASPFPSTCSFLQVGSPQI
jgi:hypothetical protein